MISRDLQINVCQKSDREILIYVGGINVVFTLIKKFMYGSSRNERSPCEVR